MASFSTATRELVLKLVYYGPGLGGKTTSLKALHEGVRAEHRGKMISLTTPVDRTLYFDFLPVRLPSIGDLQLRLQLFTVPGQVYFNATRKLVLTGADGIVFVADSQAARLDANTESLNNLRDNLLELGREFETVPVVLAYNKRDLRDVLSVDELDRELNPHGFPSLATSAAVGKGVFETLDAVVRLALDDLRQRRVIPADVTVPNDGIIAERLAEVRESEPTGAQPARIVAGDLPRAPSIAMEAVGVERHQRPTLQSPPGGASLAAQSPAGGAPLPAGPPPLPPRAVAAAEAAPAAPSATAQTVPIPAPTPAEPAPAPAPAPSVARASAPSLRRPSSFAPLFEAEDQEMVRTIEEALAEAIFPRAVLLLEALLVRVIERAARTLGRPDAAHESTAWSLAVQPERYARLRATAQRARRGGEVSRRDVLEAYLVVASAQLSAVDLAR